MPNNNLIKAKQLDPSVADFIRQITSGNISAAIQSYVPTGYMGPNVLYITGTIQSVSGQKNFALPITIPYSGGTGQTITRQYLSDYVSSSLASQVSALLSGIMHTTGNETIYGTKTFDFISGNILGFTGNVYIPTPSASSTNRASAVNLDFFYNQGIIFSSGTQMISGNKQFTSPPTMIEDATQSGQAIKFHQLFSTGRWLQMQIDALAMASGSQISGFGGVISFNAQSGNLFAIGRGSVTVTQQGNVTFVSGIGGVRAGTGVLTTGVSLISATWVLPDSIINVTPQAAPPDPSAFLFVSPADIVSGVSFAIRSNYASDSRTVFWMATGPT